MKKLFFAAVAAIVMSVLTSCGNSNSNNTIAEEKFEKGIFTTAKTEMVEITFEKEESPYFDVSMRTGSAKDNIVWISFYRVDAIDASGHVKIGAVPCRYYQIILPPHEVAKNGAMILLSPKERMEQNI